MKSYIVSREKGVKDISCDYITMQAITAGSFLNQIFYRNNKFDEISQIHSLQKWMLTADFLEHKSIAAIDSETVKSCPIAAAVLEPIVEVKLAAKPCVTVKSPSLPRDFRPTKEDTLFWCAFAAHHGAAEYWVIGNRYKNVEIQEKQRILEWIRVNPSILKNSGKTKISQGRIQETMSELMVNKKTSWATFWAICIYYKIHVFIVYNNTYMDFLPDMTAATADEDPIVPTYIFSRSQDGHISSALTPATSDDIEAICSTHVRLDRTMDKPLRAASSYKSCELEEMAKKLGILRESLGTKPKKIDWYNAVLQKCTW